MNKRTVGTAYEEKAAKFLTKQGYEILEQNYRSKAGEIDLIAKEGGYLVFLEVKYRSSMQKGGALDAVDSRKQKKICRTALYYLKQHGYGLDTPCRFDVAGIDDNRLRLVKNAFDFNI